MRSVSLSIQAVLIISLFVFGLVAPVQAKALGNLAACEKFGFSTEEEFVAGVEPWDGNPIISDGDLLSPDGQVCARNWELLSLWALQLDLGLDAVDLVDLEKLLVAFSTEIPDPQGRFTSGDLLATNGVVIPNQALLLRFQVGRNLGLDGLHLVGDPQMITTFLDAATQFTREDWLDGAVLPAWLERYDIDIWFSTEGSERRAAAVPIYDGDILSARYGAVVLSQDQLLAGVPAGIPKRGVDFGVDGLAGRRKPDHASVRFSTEILYHKEPVFDDGDVLRAGVGVETVHSKLIAAFEPKAEFLGIDALHLLLPASDTGGTGGDQPLGADDDLFLPVVQATGAEPGGGQ